MPAISFFMVLILLIVVVPFVLDYYIFRNWSRFVRSQMRHQENVSFAWTLPMYRVLLLTMPLVLLIYFFSSNWWDVEPKMVRWAIMGSWAFYYVPKVPIGLVLLVRDALRAVSWLFRWFQERLAPAEGREEPSLDLTDMKRESRRQFLREVGWTAATVPFVVVGYSVFQTLYDFKVHRVAIPVSNLPRALEGLTVAQLSDLHAGSFFSERPMEEVAAVVEGLRPDVIALTGDYVNSEAEELDLILPALRRFDADLGVFGCLGNHDHYARVGQVRDRLESLGITLLVNQHQTLSIDGARLHLVGTDNTGFSQDFADLPRALAGVETDENGEDTFVLLAHDPTFWDNYVRQDYPEIDVMLSGHTHGGQVGLEVGPYRWSVSRLVYERWAGLYREPRAKTPQTDQFLYVNRGVGTVGPPLRMGIRPEITLLTLRRNPL